MSSVFSLIYSWETLQPRIYAPVLPAQLPMVSSPCGGREEVGLAGRIGGGAAFRGFRKSSGRRWASSSHGMTATGMT